MADARSSAGPYLMEKLQIFCLQVCMDISSGVQKYISSLPENDGQKNNEYDTIHECGPAILNLLWRQAKLVSQQQGDWALLKRRLDDLISLAKGKFYAYPFKDVPECWRRLFTDASLVKFCSLALESNLQNERWQDIHANILGIDSEKLDAMVMTLDSVIIMTGSPGVERRAWIEKIMSLLEPLCEPLCEPFSTSEVVHPSKRRKTGSLNEDSCFLGSTAFVPEVEYPVMREVQPSFKMFEKYMKVPRDPLIGPRPMLIENAIEHWPARNEHPWNRPSYLLSKTLNGRRFVPVEVGRSYVDDGWGQKIISFKAFMSDYLLRVCRGASGSTEGPMDNKTEDNFTGEDDSGQDSRTGYLAQHDLFTQIPSLRADISIPDYCYTYAPTPHPSSPLASKHNAMPKLAEPLLNAWLGPAGTISPMHVDPYHNILAQVVGRKYIRLFAPRESVKLYARGVEDGGVDMSNTSALDIGILEGWDGTKEQQNKALQNFPLYSSAEYVDVILQEGECLYIPLGWWHYVRSLSVSFSVSFWWN